MTAGTARGMHRLSPMLVGVLVAGMAACYGAAEVRQHGVTVDAPSLFYSGDRTLFWLTHRHVERAMDLWAQDPPDFHSNFDRNYSVAADRVHFPVLPSFFAALGGQILSGKLHLTSDLDGHLFGLFTLHVLGLFGFGYLAVLLLGPWPGLFAAVCYALFPALLGHAFNNPKDVACTDFYACGLLAAAYGVLRARPAPVWAAGLLFGLSLSGKINGVFALLTLFLWLPGAYLLLYAKQRKVSVALAVSVLALPYTAAALFFVLWPWLYFGGVPDWISHLFDYLSFMAARGTSERPTWTNYGFRCVLFQTPPLVLGGAAAYLALGLRGGREAVALWSLLVLWLALPMLRIALPHSDFYDANRHFLEYLPALCCMAGLGLAALGERVWAHLPPGRPSTLGVGALGLLGLGSLCYPIWKYQPYETAYFNILAGGLGGAQRSALFHVPPPHPDWVNGTEGDFWFSSLRGGLEHLSTVAPAPIEVGLCGVWPPQAQADWPDKKPFRFELYATHREAPYVYAGPRESFCGWDTIQDLERSRPVLYREERGGGLIYELFGPLAGHPLPPSSRITAYNKRYR